MTEGVTRIEYGYFLFILPYVLHMLMKILVRGNDPTTPALPKVCI